MEKRICKRCLLAETDNDKVKADIDRAISLMAEDIKASDKEYSRRLDICRQCDDLIDGTCNKCGCYVELRAAARSSDCPYKKWSRSLKNQSNSQPPLLAAH